MAIEKARSELIALAKDQASRTKSAAFKDLYLEIEAAISAGVSHEKIIRTLNANNLTLTDKQFQNYLYRTRQAVDFKKTNSTPEPQQQEKPNRRQTETAIQTNSTALAISSNNIDSSNPKLLDSIIGKHVDLAALAKLSRPKK
jgi:hypothetical protein